MWYVYVLRSQKNGRLYIGSTNDIARRLAQHSSGKSKYTSNLRPLYLIYQETFKTRLEARRRELFFKSGKGRELLKTLLSTGSVR